MTTATSDPRVQVALYRSAVYEALSLAFAYPTEEVRERLAVLLDDMCEFPVDVAEELRTKVRMLRDALSATQLEAHQIEHNRLFDQSALCSPFETEYEADPFAKSRQMADISGFYAAFGLVVSSARPTMHDFIGSELEFMSTLTRREAYATARRWTRRRDIALEAEVGFLRDHLGRWERTLCADMVKALETDQDATAAFYREVAATCERFVEDELRMFKVRPLRLKRRMMGEVEPMTCPLAPDVSAVDAGSIALGDAEEFGAEIGVDEEP